MRTIRVKQENQKAVIEALQAAGFAAKPSFAPLSEIEHESNSYWEYENWTYHSLEGMAGVETSASGNQAHKVIKSLKSTGVIQ